MRLFILFRKERKNVFLLFIFASSPKASSFLYLSSCNYRSSVFLSSSNRCCGRCIIAQKTFFFSLVVLAFDVRVVVSVFSVPLLFAPIPLQFVVLILSVPLHFIVFVRSILLQVVVPLLSFLVPVFVFLLQISILVLYFLSFLLQFVAEAFIHFL